VSSRESRVTGHAGHGSKSVTHCHLCIPPSKEVVVYDCQQACTETTQMGDYSAPPHRAARSTVMSVSVCLSLCVSLCVFVCPRSYLRNYTSDLHQFFLHVAMARSSSGDLVIRYVLPVMWMTSYSLTSQGCSTSPPS